MPRRLIIISAILLSLSPSPVAAAPATAGTTLHGMASVRRFFELPASLDPDQPRLEYGNLGGRWHAMGGAETVAFGLRSSWLSLGAVLIGFIELSNFIDDDPVPWQAYRASFGFAVVLGSPKLDALLPGGGRLLLRTQISHESDHAADLDRYVARYTVLPNSSLFPNGWFASFEYIKLRLWYLQPLWGERLELAVAFGARFFLPSFNGSEQRQLDGSVSGEAQLGWRFTPRHRLWLGLFAEALLNDFHADNEPRMGFSTSGTQPNAFRGDLAGEPLVQLTAELGLDWDPSRAVILVPYLRLADAHGRGLDFPSRRQEVGAGLRFLF